MPLGSFILPRIKALDFFLPLLAAQLWPSTVNNFCKSSELKWKLFLSKQKKVTTLAVGRIFWRWVTCEWNEAPFGRFNAPFSFTWQPKCGKVKVPHKSWTRKEFHPKRSRPTNPLNPFSVFPFSSTARTKVFSFFLLLPVLEKEIHWSFWWGQKDTTCWCRVWGSRSERRTFPPQL